MERQQLVVVVDAQLRAAHVAAQVNVGDADPGLEQLFQLLRPAEFIRLARQDHAEIELAGVAAGFGGTRARRALDDDVDVLVIVIVVVMMVIMTMVVVMPVLIVIVIVIVLIVSMTVRGVIMTMLRMIMVMTRRPVHVPRFTVRRIRSLVVSCHLTCNLCGTEEPQL
jgi:hypothetical protein